MVKTTEKLDEVLRRGGVSGDPLESTGEAVRSALEGASIDDLAEALASMRPEGEEPLQGLAFMLADEQFRKHVIKTLGDLLVTPDEALGADRRPWNNRDLQAFLGRCLRALEAERAFAAEPQMLQFTVALRPQQASWLLFLSQLKGLGPSEILNYLVGLPATVLGKDEAEIREPWPPDGVAGRRAFLPQ